MYKAKIKLNGKEYKGTLTFATIKEIQEVLETDFEKKLTVTQIFEALEKKDLIVISTFILATLKELNKEKENEIVRDFAEDGQDSLEELENKFKKMITYVNDIFKKCMPLNSKKEVNKRQFVSLNEESGDWEYDNLEFLWNSILKRNNNFLDITPKNFFEQVNAYKKANKIQDEEVVIG